MVAGIWSIRQEDEIFILELQGIWKQLKENALYSQQCFFSKFKLIICSIVQKLASFLYAIGRMLQSAPNVKSIQQHVKRS